MSQGSTWCKLLAMLALVQGCSQHWNPPPPAANPPAAQVLLQPQTAAPTAQGEVLALLAADRFATLDASADLNERPLLTYMHALDISSSNGHSRESRELLYFATRIDPANFVVRQKYMLALEPRWGGSVRQMRAFLEECRNANLPALSLLKLEAVIVADQAGTDYDSHRYAAAASG